MEELKFVLKSLFFTAAIVVLMQVKIGGDSIENQSFHWLQKSGVSQYIQSVAAGGAMALRQGFSSTKHMISNMADGFHQGSESKAIR